MTPRALLLACFLLSVPLTGCLDGGAPAQELSAPNAMQTGLVLTYELDQGDGANEQSFFVLSRGGSGYDLLPWNVTEPGLESPFLAVSEQLTPRSQRWAGLIQFPLVDGATYETRASGEPVYAGTEEVTVEVSWQANMTSPQGPAEGWQLVAENEAGEEVARIHLLSNPTVPSLIEVQTADGTAETWHLLKAEQRVDWNGVPRWELGDWWSYDAYWLGQSYQPKMVFTGNQTGESGNIHYRLDPVRWENRELARLFHVIRQQDLASQSGSMTNMLSQMWSWPLRDGATWTGSTFSQGADVPFQARVSFQPDLPLPDGTPTVGFTIQARTQEDPEPFATWTYAPRVESFTNLTLHDPNTGETTLAWRLVDFGEQFHGIIEAPQRVTVYANQSLRGPASVEATMEIPPPAQRVEFSGFAARGEEGSPNSTMVLRDANGTEVARIGPGTFAADRGFPFREFVRASPGNWTFEADIQEGTSIFLQIFAHWGLDREVDFRR
ncbi:MAG: hypothetical protein R3185_04070 [Candidatus Thermoplasmatota archaeon]|nr:hypothetical protein [Candidatus Thermoplasmatota archaeon]